MGSINQCLTMLLAGVVLTSMVALSGQPCWADGAHPMSDAPGHSTSGSSSNRTYTFGSRTDHGHNQATIAAPDNFNNAWQNYVNFVKAGKKIKTCKDNLYVTTNLQIAQQQIDQNITNATTNIQRASAMMQAKRGVYLNCQGGSTQILDPDYCKRVVSEYEQYQSIVQQNQPLLAQNQSRAQEARWHLNNLNHQRNRMNCDQAYQSR